eukprot:160760_1
MSWWQEAVTSGVESIKQATQDIANELAEVDNLDINDEDLEEEDQELQYEPPKEDIQRFQEMYGELERAYNIQRRELDELRTVNQINQETNKRLQEELTVQSKSNTNTSSPDKAHSEELHDFKKKTKLKWDEVKVKIKGQRQIMKALEEENKELKHKYKDKIVIHEEFVSFKRMICEELRSNIRSHVVRMESKYKHSLEDIANIRDALHSVLYTNGILKHQTRNKEGTVKDALLSLTHWIQSKDQRISKLESQWITVCNELDEMSNARNELETECDRLHEEVEHHQAILEETRIATQDLIDQEQQQNDKLMEELKRLSDENKVLMAQKDDLTTQLHSKLKTDLISDSDAHSNIESLQNEIDALKLNINTLKEHQKRKLNQKDEDIMALNTLISELKMECEELKALQSDYIQLSKKYKKEKLEFETKKTAFNNLQIAFDALQLKLTKAMAQQSIANVNVNANTNENDDRNSSQNAEETMNKLKEMTLKYENMTKQFQDIRSKLSQSQKYQIRLEHETASLRSTISKTAIKLKNLSNSEDQVDRRIIIKLLVTFFDRWYNGGDTKEVISLLSKILRFDGEECKKCRVGFDSKTNMNYSLWGYATSWMSYNTEDDTDAQDNEKPKDLGSLWVEFLLNELADEQKQTADEDNDNDANESNDTNDTTNN